MQPLYSGDLWTVVLVLPHHTLAMMDTQVAALQGP
jgi:hypothetical protein